MCDPAGREGESPTILHGHRPHRSGVAVQDERGLGLAELPDTNRAVVLSGYVPVTIRADAETGGRSRRLAVRANHLAGRQIEQVDKPIGGDQYVTPALDRPPWR